MKKMEVAPRPGAGVATSLRRYVQDRPLGAWSARSASVNLMRDRLSRARNLFRKDLLAHYGCVNALEFSSLDGSWLVSGGDDRRVLLWNVEKAIQGSGVPVGMKGEHSSNIFCLAFDNSNQKIFSAGNDEQVIVHDTQTGETLDVFLHEEAVYGISVDPLNSNVFATACDDGRILIWDIREPNSRDPFCLASYSSAFHAVMFNPMEPRLLVTANSKDPGISLWDVRHPHNWLLKYGASGTTQSCMSVRFNQSGTQILALRRRLPPVLFDIGSATQKCQFDHNGYYNSCTMKSCCFAGDDDQYVLSGSDNFNLYMWKIPEEGCGRNWVDEAHIVLRGHRSIVNQVRFNTCNFLLASSGVEKIIKLWSPFTIPRSTGGLLRSSHSADKERKVYSHMEYINMVMHGGQVMTHDYSQRSTQEDPRMMAFFDSLVQREIEGLVSDDDDETNDSSSHSNAGGGGNSWLSNLAGTAILSNIESSDDSSDTHDDVDEDDDDDNDDGAVAAVSGPTLTAANDQSDSNSEPAVANGDDSSDSQHGVTNAISWLIRRKRQQLLEAARAKCRRDLETGEGSSPPPPSSSSSPTPSRRLSSQRRARRSSSSSDTTSWPYGSPDSAAPETNKTIIATSPSSSSSSSSNSLSPSSSHSEVAGPSSSSVPSSRKNNKCNLSSGEAGTTSDDRRKSLRKRRARIMQNISSSDSDDSNSDSGVDGEVPPRPKRSCIGDGREATVVVVSVAAGSGETKEGSATSTPDSGIVMQSSEKEEQPSPQTPVTSTNGTATKVNERFKRSGRPSRGRRQYRSAPID